jgi:hypothetical protein
MLQNKLTEIKGRLLEMMFEQYRDMNTDYKTPEGDKINYEEFYLEIQSAIKDVQCITSLNMLEIFCEKYGLNDMDNEMSFPNLVKEAYKN